MPKRRDLIRMTEEEIDAFLAGRRVMNIATHNHDGTIHLVAMWYGFTGDGRVAFETFAKSQKVKNLTRATHGSRRSSRPATSHENLRGVELVGTAEVTEDPDVLMPIARSVVERYIELTNPADAEPIAAAMARNRAAVTLNVERVVSWDHTKLGGTY